MSESGAFGQRIAPVELPPPASPLLCVIGNNERLLEFFRTLTTILVRGSELPQRARWIVTIRMSWRCHCAYEFGRHAKDAPTPELLEIAIGSAETPGLTESDRLLLRLVDQLYEHHDLDDETFSALSALWTVGQLLELVTVAGIYWLGAAVANVARVQDGPAAAH